MSNRDRQLADIDRHMSNRDRQLADIDTHMSNRDRQLADKWTTDRDRQLGQ